MEMRGSGRKGRAGSSKFTEIRLYVCSRCLRHKQRQLAGQKAGSRPNPLALLTSEALEGAGSGRDEPWRGRQLLDEVKSGRPEMQRFACA